MAKCLAGMSVLQQIKVHLNSLALSYYAGMHACKQLMAKI